MASASAWTDAGSPTLDDAALAADVHLVISEVMTGGTSASDEFIEIYNPSPSALPLEGLELVYVTASGATITRKASWPAGSAELSPGAHFLVANEAGLFAGLGDATYASGLSATGGSVALRIEGASTAIDAVGWGATTSTWLEGTPVAAPAAGHSLERLPGGAAGSGMDTDQNAVDFVERDIPDPQNLLSAPIPVETASPTASHTGTSSPTATLAGSATPAVTPTLVQTPMPTPTPAATPSATPVPAIPVAQARSMPDGSTVTVAGVALTDSDFTDGGGYLIDESAGIAVLVSDGSFQRGDGLLVTGTLDDRYYQRTIRADASNVTVLGPAPQPAAEPSTTGAAGEAVEGRLLEIDGFVHGSPTALSAGVAYDVDDGSGPLRVVVGSATGIDISAWQAGVRVHLRGVLGQRDSTGGGTAGYRLQPRDSGDVLATDSPEASPTPNPSATQGPGAVTIDVARRAPAGSQLVVEGVVTMGPGLIDPDSAVIQDATAAILLRLSEEARGVSLGDHVRVTGTRTTKTGMEAIRVSVAPVALAAAAAPRPQRSATGSLGEDDEAALVAVRGSVATTPRRSSAQNVYFDLDDGSGPIRIYIAPDAGIDADAIVMGTWLDVTGVLAQETTGRQPERGYRLWPRAHADVSIIPGGASSAGASPGSEAGGGSGGPSTTPGFPSHATAPGPVGPRTAGDGLVPPRLARAAATASPPPSVVSSTVAPSASAHRTLSAMVVALAALLLLAAAWLLAGPELLDRLLALAGQPVHGAAQPAAGSSAVADSLGEAGSLPHPAAALVPLEVMDGGAFPTRGGSERDRT
jgi:hypothetical protein